LSQALALGGKVTYLNETEAAKIGKLNDEQVDRPWELWKSEVASREQIR
jgi:hypothetical protein